MLLFAKLGFLVGLSLAESAKQEGPLAAGNCRSLYRLIVDNPEPPWALFELLYGSAEPNSLGASAQEDAKTYLKLLDSPRKEEMLFVHGGIKPLKQLNDRVFAGEESAGKKDVDSSRNLFRVLFFENLLASPVHKYLKGQFLDFKTFELAFDRKNSNLSKEQILAEVNHVIAQTQMQFEKAIGKYLASNPTLRAKILRERGITGDLRAWHPIGAAEGDPDVAATMARIAAKEFDPEKSTSLRAKIYDEALVSERVSAVEIIRSRLSQALPKGSPVLSDYEGARVLSHDSIDILRKVSAPDRDSYIKTAREKFKRRLGVDLSPGQIIDLRDYYSAVDDFQPAIRVVSSDPSPLPIPKNGLLNVDIAGQNVVNTFHTMGAVAKAALAKQSKGLEAIRESRSAEAQSTKRLEYLKQTFDEIRKRAGIEGPYRVSGDDGSVAVRSLPTEKQRDAFHRDLRRMVEIPSDYRVVWVAPMKNAMGEIDVGAMSRESVKAENLEKKLREELYGNVTDVDGLRADEILRRSAFSIAIDGNTKTLQLYVIGGHPSMDKTVSRVLADGLVPDGYRLLPIIRPEP